MCLQNLKPQPHQVNFWGYSYHIMYTLYVYTCIHTYIYIYIYIHDMLFFHNFFKLDYTDILLHHYFTPPSHPAPTLNITTRGAWWALRHYPTPGRYNTMGGHGLLVMGDAWLVLVGGSTHLSEEMGWWSQLTSVLQMGWNHQPVGKQTPGVWPPQCPI